jgi:putative PIN family toxin of toxin-antitoxin system
VLDTNVVVSRFMVPVGKSAQIIKHWEERSFTLLISKPLFEEYSKVMGYKHIRRRHRLTDEQVADVLAPFLEFALLVEPKVTVKVVNDDPDDDKLLECALAGGADYIISGDAHMLTLKEYQAIEILSPAAFLLLLEQGHSK